MIATVCEQRTVGIVLLILAALFTLPMIVDCFRTRRPSTPPTPDVALVHDLAEQGGWLR